MCKRGGGGMGGGEGSSVHTVEVLCSLFLPISVTNLPTERKQRCWNLGAQYIITCYPIDPSAIEPRSTCYCLVIDKRA